MDWVLNGVDECLDGSDEGTTTRRLPDINFAPSSSWRVRRIATSVYVCASVRSPALPNFTLRLFNFVVRRRP